MPAQDPIRELHESSLALLAALRQRSPLFLEHLERRELALRALKPASPSDLPLLRAAAAAGEAAFTEAQRLRQESLNSLNRLDSHRLLAQGLAAGTDYPCATLDVKA
jgi:hypothetical protein